MTTFTSYKRLGGLLALFLLFVAAPVLRADTLTWDWSYTDFGKEGYSGSGTITTTTNSHGEYTITGITGTWDGDTIYGILAPKSYSGNDNLLSSRGILDSLSFVVETPGKKGKITDVDWNIKSTGFYYQATGKGWSTDKDGNFCITLEPPSDPGGPVTTSPVPEPSSFVLLGTALMAFAGFAWFRKQSPAAVTTV